jgi:hypothetical protein
MEQDNRNLGLAAAQQAAMGFVGKQYNPNQDYLDRVALEALKSFLVSDHYDGTFEELARDSYALARAMLKERSREVGE